jgi:hypothetical protein
MNALTSTLKTILNGLAMQYEADYLSADDKKANLQRVLAEIEREKQYTNHSKSNVSPASNPTLAFHAK